jgi:hypothetical protein
MRRRRRSMRDQQLLPIPRQTTSQLALALLPTQELATVDQSTRDVAVAALARLLLEAVALVGGADDAA